MYWTIKKEETAPNETVVEYHYTPMVSSDGEPTKYSMDRLC